MAASATSSAPAPTPTPAAPASGQTAAAEDRKRLYVRWEVSDESLKAAFHGAAEARVIRAQRLRPFGFVTFDSEEAAVKAKAALEGKDLKAGPLHIEFASTSMRKRGAPREKRVKGEGKDGKVVNDVDGADSSAAAGEGGRGRGRGRGRRRGRGAARGGRGASTSGSDSAAAASSDGKNGSVEKSERGRGRGRRERGTATTRGGTARRGRTAAEAYAAAEAKDPNYGKQVQLSPDPVSTPVAKDAPLTELVAGPRVYRRGTQPTDAKAVVSLVLQADPSKGPFHCDVKLSGFELKLLSVRVVSRAGDTRVMCRVTQPATTRSREVYFRNRVGSPQTHKFLELRKQEEKDATGPLDLFYVAIDSITLDVATGLWSKLVLSLVSLTVPRASVGVGRGRPPVTAASNASAPAAASAT